MMAKEEVYEKAKKHLVLNIGNLVAPGEPAFDKEKNLWTVPVKYQSNIASFFLDSVVLNSDGSFVYLPTRESLCESVKERLEGRITIKIDLKPEKEKLEEVKKFIEKMKPEAVLG